MIKQERTEGGKFASKSDKPREVRSVRLTDQVWNTLGEIADLRSITRADLIEDLAERGIFDVLIQPPDKELQILVDQQKNQIKTLEEKIIDLEEKLLTTSPCSLEDLKDIRDRILFSLKLGKQSAIYKEVKKQLSIFIAELEKIFDF